MPMAPSAMMAATEMSAISHLRRRGARLPAPRDVGGRGVCVDMVDLLARDHLRRGGHSLSVRLVADVLYVAPPRHIARTNAETALTTCARFAASAFGWLPRLRRIVRWAPGVVVPRMRLFTQMIWPAISARQPEKRPEDAGVRSRPRRALAHHRQARPGRRRVPSARASRWADH